jgi:hypothetical protein
VSFLLSLNAGFIYGSWYEASFIYGNLPTRYCYQNFKYWFYKFYLYDIGFKNFIYTILFYEFYMYLHDIGCTNFIYTALVLRHFIFTIYSFKDPGKNMSSISPCVSLEATEWGTVTIQVRIGPPHPLVCRKRRLNGAAHRMKPEKTRSRVTTGVAR